MLFYVYTLSRPNGEIFYVGKGCDDRIEDHEREARRGIDSHKCRIIRKIWREGGEVQRTKVFETDNEQDAFVMEWGLINTRIGRHRLANVTDGGEGTTGFRHSEEERQRRSLRMTGYKPSEVTRAIWRRQRTGKKFTKETAEKRLATMRERGTVLGGTPEHMQTLRELNTGRPRSAETRAKISASLMANPNRLGRKDSPETIEKRAAKLRGRHYHSEETRALFSAQRKGRKQTPETKAKRLETFRKTIEKRRLVGGENVC